ncbi:uncharacterized protein FIESC28_00475 [Fusarium coffeatum]|uniref:C2H2-type domain-containing protein n=1 Tax=Fusarium coffeatum TaxID=231269 RepID=A0A366SCK5_9HYPO|nr:uncharacterized protein FIESC28_00475 [Fusarium coffeatum]RBR26692.1 hypothetical protein FIESC28_00475 [Fusarium coffeatum]
MTMSILAVSVKRLKGFFKMFLCGCCPSSMPIRQPKPSSQNQSTVLTQSTVRKLPETLDSRHLDRSSTLLGATRGVKRTRTDQCRSYVGSQPDALLHGCVTPLTPKYGAKYESPSSSDQSEGESIDLWEQRQFPTDVLEDQRHKIKTQALKRFKKWRAETKYVAPREDRLPPRKRGKRSSTRSIYTQSEDEVDISDEELVVVSQPARTKLFLHLACPFQIFAPEEYQKCLLKDDLQSIEELNEHLFRCHSRPIHCLICYKTFDTLIQRDDHVLSETCQKRDVGPEYGLDESQKSNLIRGDSWHLGERRRWYRHWSVIFPGSKNPPSPYLDRGLGLSISMMRDFWESHGSQCVSDCLEQEELTDDQGESVQRVLYELTLEDLLGEMIQEDDDLVYLNEE